MKTILYVDDEETNLFLFNAIFKSDYNILLASSAQQGLDIVNKQNDISVVISDMKMPGMNGVEFITKLKQDRPNLTCFILTAYGINTEINSAINQKIISRYFQKPLNKREIIRALEELNYTT